MALSFNPMQTTQPASSFLLQSDGYVQGAFFDDPSARLWLATGYIAYAVTQPIWGAMAITELVPTSNQLGNELELATTVANTTAFTVFNQASNMIITPGNTVQQADAGMTVSYFRLGSNARIAVQCDPTLAGTLDGGATNQEVLWDFTNQKLITYTSGTALPVKVLSVNTNSKIVSYNSGTGALTWTTGACAIIQI
ncbi:MAG: hypothetical protein G3I10_07425 [Ferrovum sp.]|nr:hypothetical protein [Ferrovum sp.]